MNRIKYLIIILIGVFMVISCNTGGHLGVSVSMSESIERKTYIDSYTISDTYDSLSKELSGTILEIFSEEPWYVGGDYTFKPDFINIIIRTNNDRFFNEYKLEGFTQTDMNVQIHRHNKDLQKDTLLIPVYRITKANKIIDTIVFIRECKNNNQTHYYQSDSINTLLVNPERVYFDLSDRADYNLDFKKALKDRDYRFVGILEFALTVPEVPDYLEKYRLSYGVKIINGTGDSFTYQDSTNNRIEFCKSYAKGYNKLLLDYLEKKH